MYFKVHMDSNIRKSLLSLRLAVALVLCLDFNIAKAQNEAVHEVKAGETLYGIAKSYGVSVKDIQNTNPGLKETLMTGQTIRIPNRNSGGNIHHTIEAGETLYGISKRYGVTVNAVVEMNPGLTAANFRTGTVIVIPQGGSSASEVKEDTIPGTRKKGCKLMYEVQKKETLYSIARKFKVTEQDLLDANPELKGAKLKKKTYICIPYSVDEVYTEPDNETVFQRTKKQATKFEAINVAVILPFNLGSKTATSESLKMLDFYEGFLLAVDSLRSRGVAVNVYAYDEAESMESIVKRPMLAHMNVIIGPGRNANIARLSQFAGANNIPLIVPLSSKAGLADNNKNVFQVNAHHSKIYKRLFSVFVEQHKGDNIVFVGMNDSGDKSDYVAEFKKALGAAGIPYSAVSFASLDELTNYLKEGKNNVLIPSASSQNAFEMLTYKLNTMNSIETYGISLFGYPEWQTFTSKADANLAKYQCSFYSTFYVKEGSGRLSRLNRNFIHWFKREQYNSYPRYALLGYDIGAFAIKGLDQLGSDFVMSPQLVNYSSVQTPLSFVRGSNWSGFTNNSVMVVKYSKSGATKVSVYR